MESETLTFNNTSQKRYSYSYILVASAGTLMILISMIVQMYSLYSGSSGQLQIDNARHISLGTILFGAVVAAIGFGLYIRTLNDAPGSGKFLMVYLLAFSSFFIANMALMFSTVQVTVAPA
jgi:hypothetical protein